METPVFPSPRRWGDPPNEDEGTLRLRQVVAAQENIRQKVRQIKRAREESSSFLTSSFQPIVDPLQSIAEKIQPPALPAMPPVVIPPYEELQRPAMTVKQVLQEQ